MLEPSCKTIVDRFKQLGSRRREAWQSTTKESDIVKGNDEDEKEETSRAEQSRAELADGEREEVDVGGRKHLSTGLEASR